MLQDNYVRSATIRRNMDGDTIEILMDLGDEVFRKRKVRLTTIDTPEVRDPGYQAAKDFTAQFTGQDCIVKTYKFKGDKYNRLLADVYVAYDGSQQNLSELLLARGLAKYYGT